MFWQVIHSNSIAAATVLNFIVLSFRDVDCFSMRRVLYRMATWKSTDRKVSPQSTDEVNCHNALQRREIRMYMFHAHLPLTSAEE